MPYTFRIYLLIIFTSLPNMHDTQDLRLYVVEKRVYFPHWCIALNLSLHLSNTESKYFEKKMNTLDLALKNKLGLFPRSPFLELNNMGRKRAR